MRKISGITFHLYHYAGNNPVKYIDPDGRFVWGAIPIIILGVMSLKSDKQPKPTPVNADHINTQLSNIYYNDPKTISGPSLKTTVSKIDIGSVTLESHPLLALSCAMPRGSYSESDYSSPNQFGSKTIQNFGTVLDGLNLAGSIMNNLADGHVGDVKIKYKTENGKMTEWQMSLTTINPVNGRATGRDIFSKEDALKYLESNKEVLKNDPEYKKLQYFLD